MRASNQFDAELATDIIVRLDRQRRFVYCNPAGVRLLGEVVGRSSKEVTGPNMRQTSRSRHGASYEFQCGGRWFGVNVQMLIEGNRITGFQAIAREFAPRRTFLEELAANAPGIVYVFDLVERRTVFANRELTTILGYKREEWADFDQIALRVFHPDDLPAMGEHHEALRHSRDGDVQHVEYRARHADGHWVWLSAWESPFARDADGRVSRIVGIAQDVTARNAARERLAWHANYDALTRLSNRRHFSTSLQNLLRRASMDQVSVSLCLFDIDQFKEINDRFGHRAGDEVLEAVGSIVRSELGHDDISGRLGGDEFCFALLHVSEEEAARIAERMRERLNTMAFGMNGDCVPFTASATFGVTAWRSQMGAQDLMDAADKALYNAKTSGRNKVFSTV